MDIELSIRVCTILIFHRRILSMKNLIRIHQRGIDKPILICATTHFMGEGDKKLIDSLKRCLIYKRYS